MPTVRASRELLAPIEDVWEFVSEPHNLPNWWPRMGGVHPDRRGLAPGARWQVTGENKPTILRRPEAVGYLIVVAVEPRQRIAFQLTGDRLEVELTLEPAARRRTKASLKVEGPWLVGLSRALPRHALHRLYSLVQTGAT